MRICSILSIFKKKKNLAAYHFIATSFSMSLVTNAFSTKMPSGLSFSFSKPNCLAFSFQQRNIYVVSAAQKQNAPRLWCHGKLADSDTGRGC